MLIKYAIEKTTEAIIYLKNGKRKYGLIADDGCKTGNFHFISNNNIMDYKETLNVNYIEIISSDLIEAIETDLR